MTALPTTRTTRTRHGIRPFLALQHGTHRASADPHLGISRYRPPADRCCRTWAAMRSSAPVRSAATRPPARAQASASLTRTARIPRIQRANPTGNAASARPPTPRDAQATALCATSPPALVRGSARPMRTARTQLCLHANPMACARSAPWSSGLPDRRRLRRVFHGQQRTVQGAHAGVRRAARRVRRALHRRCGLQGSHPAGLRSSRRVRGVHCGEQESLHGHAPGLLRERRDVRGELHKRRAVHRPPVAGVRPRGILSSVFRGQHHEVQPSQSDM
jgi:hypothetical protein